MHIVSTEFHLLAPRLGALAGGAFEYLRSLRYGESLILTLSGLSLILASSGLRRLVYPKAVAEHAATQKGLASAKSTTEVSGRVL